MLKGAKDLTNRTTFREAALIIKHSQLFVGTEGGLMHAAAAVDKRALILWGGITVPSFAGYPSLHDIICKHVSCSPCGNLGWCDNGKKCMKDITVKEVLERLFLSLEANNKDRKKFEGCYGYNPVKGPWGGGNGFFEGLREYLLKAGFSVVNNLRDENIDIILIADPRNVKQQRFFRQCGDTRKYPQTISVYRINECDERKNTKHMNAKLGH